MFIELHILQNFAPSCLNRDDTNTPKDAVFGGHRRARISSQCIKRSVRTYFRDQKLIPEVNLAERSKRLIQHVAQQVATIKSVPVESAIESVKKALASVKLGSDSKNPNETQYLLFFGNHELHELAKVVSEHYEKLAPKNSAEPELETEQPDGGKAKAKKKTPKKTKSDAQEAVPAEVSRAVVAVLKGNKAADVALFGRMLADQADLNIDAASQVAHALSTNRVEMETDFFTAVDDLKKKGTEGDAGAGMLGTVEFNSACFYRYSNLDTEQLVKNLGGDKELAKATIQAFIEASVKAIPTGKQNSMAAHNPPSFVFVVVRKSGLWSLANAYEDFISPKANTSLVNGSIQALAKYWAKLTKAYGEKELLGTYCYHLADGIDLGSLAKSEVDGLDPLLESVKKTIEEHVK